MWGANLSAMSWYKTPQESPIDAVVKKLSRLQQLEKIPDLEKMAKVTRSSAKKNEEIEQLVSEHSETETETESEEEEEEESSMEETSGDEDFMGEWKTVSNIFIIIYIHII